MDNSNPNFKNIFLERAGILKRFLNYVIDLIVFVLVFGFILLILLPKQIVQDVENINPIYSNLLYTIVFGIFIGTAEGLLRGKTFGKYLTKTLTVNKDGSKIDFITGFKERLDQNYSILSIICFKFYTSSMAGYLVQDSCNRCQINTIS
ncbi:MAG: RDD family protein [Saprospiraceae bacterium]|nr:RDD family protein [Candidatus Brachybacter algidus]